MEQLRAQLCLSSGLVEGDVFDIVRRALAERNIRWKDRGSGSKVDGDESPPTVSVRIAPGPVATQLLLGGLDREGFKSVGSDTIVELLMTVCVNLDVLLARTYGDQMLAAIRTHELTDAIDCLDWFQYFGSAIASRWPSEHLRQGPFHKVIFAANGGVGLLLGDNPFDHLMSIKAAATHLEIPLRSVSTRAPDGREVEVGWH
jgi:hypothetical protein